MITDSKELKNKKNWAPVNGNIMTRWAKHVDPECPLPEYPRPQMVRENWKNLNGLWDYCIVPKEQKVVTDYEGKILVPFCIESALSGVKKQLMPDQRLWYRRHFSVPENWQGQKTLLHFGAVDWETTVFINGKEIGKHTGGYLSFTFDITDCLEPGENELVVAVWDPTNKHWQQKGKQKLNQRLIYYTPTSGIWQTVWLEAVPQNYIRKCTVTPDIDNESVEVSVFTEKEAEIQITVVEDKKDIISVKGKGNEKIFIPINHPRLWGPDNPFLYDLKIDLFDNGEVIDTISGYFGMRKFSIGIDEKGFKRLMLNNEVLFQYGTLDQGYWPDGIYTAPTDEALRYDVEMTKRLGFNMIRKHIKVEPARWYYHCDREGLIVWQDMINGGSSAAKEYQIPYSWFFRSGKLAEDDTTEKFYKKAWRNEKASRDDFEQELKDMVDQLYSVTCIGMWVIFNESWGQFDGKRITNWLKAYDTTRPVDHASGCFDQGAGDIQSHHIYIKRMKMPKIEGDRAVAISECGGYCYLTPGHVWRSDKKFFAYNKYKTLQAFERAYASLVKRQILPMIGRGCCAVVYTQITDVEIEVNGFFTYDREILKVDENRIRKLHHSLYQ